MDELLNNDLAEMYLLLRKDTLRTRQTLATCDTPEEKPIGKRCGKRKNASTCKYISACQRTFLSSDSINDCTMTWKKCLYCIAKMHYYLTTSLQNGNVRRLGGKGLLENVVGNGGNASK